MGIMYKLMKHKHGLEMDLAKRNERATHRQDKQFTAEYIIELCKFLAEKSQRNKQKQQEIDMNYKLNESFEFEEIIEMEAVNDIEMDEVVNHKRCIESTTTHTAAKQILMVKQHYNAQTFSTTTTTTTSPQQFQQDNKKDILQKIRNQIFERKRQRQLASSSSSMQRIGGVWRPW